jgi:hypothetical protein
MRNGATREHTPPRAGVVTGGVGRTGIVVPAHGGAEEASLLDRLRRADVAQFGRPVGAAHDERDVRLVCFHDGRMEVRNRGAGRAQQDDGFATALRDPERAKCGGAFVEHDVDAHTCIAVQRQRERRRARAGRHHCAHHTGARPLVDQRIRERGVAVARMHQ